MTAGSLIWGMLADQSSPAMALTLAAVLLVIGALIGLSLPLPEFAGMNLDPLNRFKEPALGFDLNYNSGPVMVMVDYQIAKPDIPEFLTVMSQRLVRIRDGAQQWALLRDLEKPGHWSESYRVPTWGEYVRHNERRTQADATLFDRLLALHRGEGLPIVHRMIEPQGLVSGKHL